MIPKKETTFDLDKVPCYCMICDGFYYSVKKKKFKFKIILKLLIIFIFVTLQICIICICWCGVLKIGNEESRYASRGSDISMNMMDDAVP